MSGPPPRASADIQDDPVDATGPRLDEPAVGIIGRDSGSEHGLCIKTRRTIGLTHIIVCHKRHPKRAHHVEEPLKLGADTAPVILAGGVGNVPAVSLPLTRLPTWRYRQETKNYPSCAGKNPVTKRYSIREEAVLNSRRNSVPCTFSAGPTPRPLHAGSDRARHHLRQGDVTR